MKYLGNCAHKSAELEVYECSCGYHLGMDGTYLEQVNPYLLVKCPSCGTTFDAHAIGPDGIKSPRDAQTRINMIMPITPKGELVTPSVFLELNEHPALSWMIEKCQDNMQEGDLLVYDKHGYWMLSKYSDGDAPTEVDEFETVLGVPLQPKLTMGAGGRLDSTPGTIWVLGGAEMYKEAMPYASLITTLQIPEEYLGSRVQAPSFDHLFLYERMLRPMKLKSKSYDIVIWERDLQYGEHE